MCINNTVQESTKPPPSRVASSSAANGNTNNEVNTKNTSNTSNNRPINYVDMEQCRREYLFTLPAVVQDWVIKHLLRRQDARNMTIFLVGVNILLTSVPAAMALFYWEQQMQQQAQQQEQSRSCTSFLLASRLPLTIAGMAYLLFHMKFCARSFLLSIHYLTHCSIFNRRFRALDLVWTAVLGNLFGIPPGLYYSHHIAMHHALDNVAPYDMSSTMDYNRSCRWNHFKYMLRFVTAGALELPYRLIQVGKWKLALLCITGCTAFAMLLVYTAMVSPIASLFVLWLPCIFCGFALMQGNFKEHIFVDPDEYENNYKSTVTCINAPSNALTFNTGYHVEHHEEPGLPWYQLPELFLKNLHKHARNDSFVFSGIGTMEVGTMVLHEQFDALADHYVNIGQPQRSKTELIAEFKRRLVPISVPPSRPSCRTKSE